LKAAITTSWSELEQLESDWNKLLFRSAASSIFLTWEWLEAWGKAIQHKVEPFVITVRDDRGALIGIAPLYLARLRFLRAIQYRTLRFVADTATGAEYPDWIVDPAAEEAVCREIAETLCVKTSDWDTIWLPNVAGWSGAPERITRSLGDAGLNIHTRERRFSVADLGDSLGDFEATIPSKRRQQMRRKTRRIKAIEGVEFVRCTAADQLPEFLDALFDLHQRRWESVGLDGTFRHIPVQEQFYRQFAPLALRRDWLCLFGLKHHGVFKAVQYGYVYGNTYHQLQEGFDPDFERDGGNALRHHMIEALINDGVNSYDFLGGWTEHKRRWGAELRHGCDIFVGSNRLKSRLLFSKEIWPSGRYIEQDGTITDL
jgi:CelD/BcsL family acetyltransferase involved in cellulose biosynthesis